ncbi:MAG: hypothetical protein KDK70_10155 [Myxococcales bacterium]|nr:hypothetical protein [Myxococcales bacterium]
MKRLTALCAVLALSLPLTACTDDDPGLDEGSNDSGAEGDRVEVPLSIDGDTTWTADRTYVLTGITFVNSGTLTIEPGTTILGGAGSALVIDEGARIDAQGTADAPIVMTSINVDTGPARGDWGGLALIGRAPTNVGEGVAEGFADDPPTYGGNDPAHACGTLRYLRVEYAGNEVSPGNELNGITFYACGSGTTVDHVQVHMGLDDGMEMFGGGFDLDHVVITGAADDSIDCDQGFGGTLSHVFIQQDPTIGDNCLEWSNQGTDFTAEPLTGPTIRNLTCIGSGPGGDKSKGVTLKEGTQATIEDSLFAQLTNDAVVLQNQATQAQAEAGAISLAGTHFCGSPMTFVVDTDEEDPNPASWTTEDFAAWVTGDAGSTAGTDCGLPSTAWGQPSIQPAAPGPMGTRGYAGAVDPAGEDWTTEGWVRLGS